MTLNREDIRVQQFNINSMLAGGVITTANAIELLNDLITEVTEGVK